MNRETNHERPGVYSDYDASAVINASRTGGAAGIVVPHCRHSVQYVPTLILDGLYAVYCRTHAAL